MTTRGRRGRQAIDEAIESAASEQPQLALDREGFAAFLLERVGEGESPDDVLPRLCHGDLLIAFSCLAGHSGAAEVFEARVRDPVLGAVAPLDGGRGIRDEVYQRMLDIALVGAGRGAPALSGYSGRGDLRSWARIVAVREAYKLLRQGARKVSVEDDEMLDVLVDAGDDPKLDSLKRTYREEFRRAFRSAVGELPKNERTALRMQVIDGLSIDEIAPVFGVHRATAARWLSRARGRLLAGTRRELKSSLGIDDAEVDSVLRLIQSRLDLTLDTAFDTPG